MVGSIKTFNTWIYNQDMSEPSALSKLQINHQKESILAGREYGFMGERLHTL